MAIEISVIKGVVSKVMDKLWNITLTMTLTENDETIFSKDYTVRYRTGDSITSKEEKFIVMMQNDINDFLSERAIYNHPLLDSAIVAIQAGLVID